MAASNPRVWPGGDGMLMLMQVDNRRWSRWGGGWRRPRGLVSIHNDEIET